jgi:hypothetical protein
LLKEQIIKDKKSLKMPKGGNQNQQIINNQSISEPINQYIHQSINEQNNISINQYNKRSIDVVSLLFILYVFYNLHQGRSNKSKVWKAI